MVEQCDAMASLLKGKEVLFLFSTGFGGSLIFQMFFVVVKIRGRYRDHVKVLVSCPLQNTIADHILTDNCSFRLPLLLI